MEAVKIFLHMHAVHCPKHATSLIPCLCRILHWSCEVLAQWCYKWVCSICPSWADSVSYGAHQWPSDIFERLVSESGLAFSSRSESSNSKALSGHFTKHVDAVFDPRNISDFSGRLKTPTVDPGCLVIICWIYTGVCRSERYAIGVCHCVAMGNRVQLFKVFLPGLRVWCVSLCCYG